MNCGFHNKYSQFLQRIRMVNTFVRFGVMAVAMVLSRFVDTSNPETLMRVRIAYVVSVVLNATIFWYIRTLVRSKHDTTKIYIVRKLLGQENVEETTYFEKEEQVCSQSITGAVSGIAMTLGLMSMKLGLHYGMVMQIIQMPFNVATNPLFQMYILKKHVDHPWDEQTEVY